MISRRDLMRAGVVAAPASWLGAAGLASVPALAPVIEWIEGSSADELLPRAGRALREGTTLESIAAALMVACCRHIPMRQLGFSVHPLWTVTPAWELGRAAGGRARGMALLHALDRFKAHQRKTPEERPPNLAPAAASQLPGAAVAPARLEAALNDFDEAAADAATVALIRAGRTETLGEIVRRFGCRATGMIGHVQVHVSQLLRAVDAFGPAVAEPTLRTLVCGLTRERGGTGTFAANLERARALARVSHDGAAAPPASRALLSLLRMPDADKVSATIAARLGAGLSARATWDALLLAATELTLRHGKSGGIFPAFHTVTGLNGFRWIYASSRDELTRRVALLQAAALVADNTTEAQARASRPVADVALDTLRPTRAGTLASLWETAAHDRPAAAAEALGWFTAGGKREDFAAALRALAFRKADEEHHFKLPQAAIEEAAAGTGALACYPLLATLGWGLTADSRDWKRLAQAEAALPPAAG
jgi:hypothetical protein